MDSPEIIEVEVRLTVDNKLPDTLTCPDCLGPMQRGFFRRLRYKCKPCNLIQTLIITKAHKLELKELQQIRKELDK